MQFLVHLWTKKGSNPNFLELWGFVLMSQMILEGKGTFFSKNVTRNRIFPFWGVWPLYSPPGARGIFSWLILAFYYRTCMISKKMVGWKFYRPKCLSGSGIGSKEKLSNGLFVQFDIAHLWNTLCVKWVRFQMTTSVFWPYKFDFIIYDLKLRKKAKDF